MAVGAAAQADIPRSLQVLDTRYDPANSRGNLNDPLECLIRKSDHRRVCHTRDGWRRIAREMEREQAGKR